MLSRSVKSAVIVSICAAVCGPAWAGQANLENGDRPTITATRLTSDERVRVDGVLDEPAWSRAEAITTFIQSDPQNDAPSTERTDVRILFDQDSLYIGAEFFDSDPTALLGNQMVRDGSLNADDRFIWVLDPLYNQRSGYYFEVNPARRDGRRAACGGRRQRLWHHGEPRVGRDLDGARAAP